MRITGLLTAFSLATAACFLPATTANAASSDAVPQATSEDVAAFEQQLIDDNDPQLAAFEALTPEQQSDVVTAVHSADPSDLPYVETTSTQSVVSSPTQSAFGALATSRNSMGITALAAATTYEVTSTSTYYQGAFGIHIGSFKQIFRYQTGNNKVLKVHTCSGVYSGFSGFVSVDQSTDFYLSSGMGYCYTIYTGSLIYKGLGIKLNKEQALIVNGPGIYDRWLQNI